jgi:uncharacterized membrane protein
MALHQGTTRLYGSQDHRAGFSAFLSRFAVRLGDALLLYWAHGLTALLGTVVFLALSVPFLFYLGLDQIARPIYFSLHLICAQIPSHSFYIFGHPLGLCERNFSIYTSMFLGSLVFVQSHRRLRGIPWWLWLLTALPIAVDGFTQMFGLRESTPELRIITGTLFGLGNVLFVLPLIQRNLVLEPSIYRSAAIYGCPDDRAARPTAAAPSIPTVLQAPAASAAASQPLQSPAVSPETLATQASLHQDPPT